MTTDNHDIGFLVACSGFVADLNSRLMRPCHEVIHLSKYDHSSLPDPTYASLNVGLKKSYAEGVPAPGGGRAPTPSDVGTRHSGAKRNAARTQQQGRRRGGYRQNACPRGRAGEESPVTVAGGDRLASPVRVFNARHCSSVI